MYDLYLNGVLMPVTPSKVQIKTKSNNKTINLINDGEVSIIKPSGLTEVSFDLLLPNSKYPFARGESKAKTYMNMLKKLKDNGTVFQFILSRKKPNGTNLGNTNLTVTMEELTFTDDAGEGFDIKAGIKLKEYRTYGTKVYSIGSQTMSTQSARTLSAEAPTTNKAYTVAEGDTLWSIAKTNYGDGSKYTKIVSANGIENPNLIKAGQKLIIPE